MNIVQLIKRAWTSPRLRTEIRRIFTYGIIGASSVGAMVGGYALFSRILWPQGPKTLEVAIVTVCVTYLNYAANKRVTFAGRISPGSLYRFTGVAVISIILNSGLFWFGHSVLHIFDIAVVSVTPLLVGAYTYTSHRLFTFHERPWRHVERAVELFKSYRRDT